MKLPYRLSTKVFHIFHRVFHSINRGTGWFFEKRG